MCTTFVLTSFAVVTRRPRVPLLSSRCSLHPPCDYGVRLRDFGTNCEVACRETRTEISQAARIEFMTTCLTQTSLSSSLIYICSCNATSTTHRQASLNIHPLNSFSPSWLAEKINIGCAITLFVIVLDSNITQTQHTPTLFPSQHPAHHSSSSPTHPSNHSVHLQTHPHHVPQSPKPSISPI